MGLKEEEVLKCFGVGPKGRWCDRCEYREACDVCLEMPDKKIDRLSKGVSYESIAFSEEVATEDDSPFEKIARKEQDDARLAEELFSIDDLKQVVEFLLRVDDYSYAILSEIVVKNHHTASGVAKKFGVTRQAIHRKIRDSCVKYPELRQMLQIHLHRCRRITRGIKTTGKRRGGVSEKQQEFNFNA